MNKAEMRRQIILILTLALFLAVGGCGEDDSGVLSGEEPDTMVMVFRDGVSPFPSYSGTRDAVIKNSTAEQLRNLNWGEMQQDSMGSRVLASGNYQMRLLIRWDLSSISSCEKVLEAELTLNLHPDSGDSVTFMMYRLDVPDNIPDSWTEGTGKGDYKTGVCWDYATDATPWDNPGSDYLAPGLFSIQTGADSTASFNLPSGIVEDWIRNPLDNDGIIIKPDYLSSGYRIVRLSENSDPDLRPRLTVRYLGYG
ncbi:MAG: DNRLRE domain-containing protein [Candidatus Latescibacteria bacterium]|nr:DNRLRE domain-containing protein [bacterium]MBD3423430.1 DNRLRE domain-containing protein [Candidatus Latescibacterota bacterium]